MSGDTARLRSSQCLSLTMSPQGTFHQFSSPQPPQRAIRPRESIGQRFVSSSTPTISPPLTSTSASRRSRNGTSCLRIWWRSVHSSRRRTRLKVRSHLLEPMLQKSGDITKRNWHVRELILVLHRQQEGQRDNHLHALVEPLQKRRHGYRPSRLPRQQKSPSLPPPPSKPYLPPTHTPFPPDQENPRPHTPQPNHQPARENPHDPPSRRTASGQRSVSCYAAGGEEEGGGEEEEGG